MTMTQVAPAQAATAEPAAVKGGKKKLVILLVAVLALGAAAYWFMLKPKPEKAPEPGEVVTLEPIQVNLAAGHYLKVGIALQLTKGTKEADGSKALDATIDLFSGQSMDQLTRTEGRERLKKQLEKELEHRYHDEVMGVYFTDFVTQ